MLAVYAEKYGYELTVVSKEMFGDREISSTYIREELEKGNMENVNQMLGYPYTISGRVEHGKQLGRTLGFTYLYKIAYLLIFCQQQFHVHNEINEIIL